VFFSKIVCAFIIKKVLNSCKYLYNLRYAKELEEQASRAGRVSVLYASHI
jgi:hypothetical protein